MFAHERAIYFAEHLNAPLWQPKQVYLAGEKVTHQGMIHQARWWLNTEPSNTNEAWQLLGMCSEHP
ncbi:hypothetical protein PCIT_a1001 [Pseudoalteromonas citrea]|uniref:Chitin-binding type-3 domain-containing protein n=2 Tax=Pseudoalteromonas citrea TaxID=43655 RepID=A0AAD4ALJ2_9GAMM|nr:carbohydrate-binding protein [Pseudoalteromonas citrea]KAF7774541.1 hypothetical protein PCIT_a1001 [Pseudoalteromonas citrea]